MCICGHSSHRVCKRGIVLLSIYPFSIPRFARYEGYSLGFHGFIWHAVHRWKASKHFGDILSEFIGSLASTTDITELPAHLRRSCIAHGGAVTTLFEYIPRMRNSDSE